MDISIIIDKLKIKLIILVKEQGFQRHLDNAIADAIVISDNEICLAKSSVPLYAVE